MKPAREARPRPMIGTQHAASVATSSVIRHAMADSVLRRAARPTASCVLRAATNIHKYPTAMMPNETMFNTGSSYNLRSSCYWKLFDFKTIIAHIRRFNTRISFNSCIMS